LPDRGHGLGRATRLRVADRSERTRGPHRDHSHFGSALRADSRTGKALAPRSLSRPFDYYAGEIRESDPRFPELIAYEVRVGPNPGVRSELVPAALKQFQERAQAVTARLDAVITASAEPHALTSVQLHGVLTLCAILHGEWVRIHPFANGNGRTARLWANWAALRYGLPPFVTIKPRPGQPYGSAAMASMNADHRVTVAVFDQMLRAYLETL
jgi:hypothetical protein